LKYKKCFGAGAACIEINVLVLKLSRYVSCSKTMPNLNICLKIECKSLIDDVKRGQRSDF